MTVLGQPVTLNGTMALAPGGRGTVVDADRRTQGRDPAARQKLEQSAAPAVLAGFRTQQKVGNDWLAG